MNRRLVIPHWLIVMICAAVICSAHAPAQTDVPGELRVHIAYAGAKSAKPPSTVVWLAPVKSDTLAPSKPGRFTLLQKNRTFVPHLLIIPVGSTVSFPNADPFFHNVFSLFNGKRFDLGLYEAGSTREVVFSREGVSYIFCNIHSEMSALVLALSTPLFAIADSASTASLHPIPPADYELHVWVEGVPDRVLNGLTRRVRIRAGMNEAATIELSAPASLSHEHLNEFGQPYDRTVHSPY